MTSRSREPAHWLSKSRLSSDTQEYHVAGRTGSISRELSRWAGGNTPSDLASSATACRFRLSIARIRGLADPRISQQGCHSKRHSTRGSGRDVRTLTEFRSLVQWDATTGGGEPLYATEETSTGRISAGLVSGCRRERGAGHLVSPGPTTNGEFEIRRTCGSNRSHELNGRRSDHPCAQSSLTPVVAAAA